MDGNSDCINAVSAAPTVGKVSDCRPELRTEQVADAVLYRVNCQSFLDRCQCQQIYSRHWCHGCDCIIMQAMLL